MPFRNLFLNNYRIMCFMLYIYQIKEGKSEQSGDNTSLPLVKFQSKSCSFSMNQSIVKDWLKNRIFCRQCFQSQPHSTTNTLSFTIYNHVMSLKNLQDGKIMGSGYLPNSILAILQNLNLLKRKEPIAKPMEIKH